VEEDESLTTRILAEQFDVDHSTIVKRLKKLGKVWKLEHPPYSPTEAPTDYHVNRSFKNWQMGKVYNDLDELVTDVKV
jgi:predicted transcriptional regulator